MTCYYNEIDKFAAQWLRNLITAGHIAPGDVDERDIRDVQPDDLIGYTQIHMFAGIGGWSYALRLARWPDDRPCWTGSCPCQPFSAAGKRKGFADERHLWPEWFRLISQRHPAVVLGEQVAQAVGWGWLDAVFSDLEGQGYAVGAAVLPACGVGAPHIRQRLWFVADASGTGAGRDARDGAGAEDQGQGERSSDRTNASHTPIPCGTTHKLADAEGQSGRLPVRSGSIQNLEPERSGEAGELAHSDQGQRRWLADGEGRERDGQAAGWIESDGEPQSGGVAGDMANADCSRFGTRRTGEAGDGRDAPRLEPTGLCTIGVAQGDAGSAGLSQRECDGRVQRETMEPPAGQAVVGGSNPWDCDWLPCTDGKARPVEPGTFPLAHGIPGRVGRLRAYGNAIVAQAAAEFIGAYQDVLDAHA